MLKSGSHFLLVLICCFFSFSCRGSEYEVRTGKPRNPEPSKSELPASIRSVSCIDRQHCWFLMGDTLHHTSDAGKSWKKIDLRSLSPNSVCFIDAQRGWLLTRSRTVFSTTDSGATWQSVCDISSTVSESFIEQSIRFFDERNGWITGWPVEILRTTNGGESWVNVTPPREMAYKDISSFFSVDTQNLFIASADGLIRTENGGQVWRAVKTPEGTIRDMFFFNGDVGWISLGTQGLYRTDDAGKTWLLQKEQGEDMDINSLWFFNRNEGWAAGAGENRGKFYEPVERGSRLGLILHTTDGGKTWIPVKVGDDEGRFMQIWFADSQYGWAFGFRTVYRTDDGGQNWKLCLDLWPEKNRK